MVRSKLRFALDTGHLWAVKLTDITTLLRKNPCGWSCARIAKVTVRTTPPTRRGHFAVPDAEPWIWVLGPTKIFELQTIVLEKLQTLTMRDTHLSSCRISD